MQLDTRKTLTFAALLGSLAAMPALADHNSVWGAGWANMPNDVHNTRIEDDLTQEEWTDFVQFGAGAATPNRYLDSASVPSAGAMMGGAAIDTSTLRGGGRR
jgi:hypothetical protein